ncbi:MAG TPA: hypothetical protein VGN26_10100 [Armatimonadota bacterium]
MDLRSYFDQLPPDTEQRVEEVCKRWKRPAMEALRRSTGLRLNLEGRAVGSAEEDVEIPVEVVEGMPRGVMSVLERLPESDESGNPLWWMARVELDLLGVYHYSGQFDNMSLVGRYLLSLPGAGAQSCVRLFWQMIGLVAPTLGSNTSDLALVVLIHELAHGLTHLGMDLDGWRWPSGAFTEAEVPVKEGLAQYFTERTLKRLGQEATGASWAYMELLRHQPGPYQVHQNWLRDYCPEAVRSALLASRHRDPCTLQQFEMEAREYHFRLNQP